MRVCVYVKHSGSGIRLAQVEKSAVEMYHYSAVNSCGYEQKMRNENIIRSALSLTWSAIIFIIIIVIIFYCIQFTFSTWKLEQQVSVNKPANQRNKYVKERRRKRNEEKGSKRKVEKCIQKLCAAHYYDKKVIRFVYSPSLFSLSMCNRKL